MTMFRTWFLSVAAASIALSILYALIPKGALLTVAKCTGGLILLLVVVRPLLSLDPASLRVSYESLRADITAQTEDYTARNAQTLADSISDKTAAYISKKAAQLGVPCTAEVRCTTDGEVPVPAEVTLDIPYHGALSEIIEQELGIGAASQHWQGGSM